MGKLLDRLNKQLKTEYKEDAENCLKIYNKLIELESSVWDSKWNLLISTIFKGFPHDERRFKPTDIGYVFLKGFNNNILVESNLDEMIEEKAEKYKQTHGFEHKGSRIISSSWKRGNDYCDIPLESAKNGLKKGFIAGYKQALEDLKTKQ